jgi:hypothetical protein
MDGFFTVIQARNGGFYCLPLWATVNSSCWYTRHVLNQPSSLRSGMVCSTITLGCPCRLSYVHSLVTHRISDSGPRGVSISFLGSKNRDHVHRVYTPQIHKMMHTPLFTYIQYMIYFVLLYLFCLCLLLIHVPTVILPNITFYRILKPNSWTYNFVEVSVHNLRVLNLRFPYTMFTLQTSFKPLLLTGGGGGGVQKQ